MKKNKTKIIVSLIILTILIGASTYLIVSQGIIEINPSSEKINGDDPYSSDPYGSAKIPPNIFEPSSADDYKKEYMLNPVWNTITQDYRPRWEGPTDEEFLQIFGSLPKMPQDFYKKYEMFMKGTLTDYDRLGPEYWKQPEWYDLDQDFFDLYYHRNPTMWNIGQVSCKPSFRYVELKPGATVQLSTFFHTESIGSEAYLGAIFYSHLPESAMKQDGTIIYEQPSNAKQYITTKIISPDNDINFETFKDNLVNTYVNVNDNERILIFPATYRVIDEQGEKVIYGFPSDWCYKVVAEIHVKDNCPPGDYIVAVDFKNPSQAIIEEYNWVFSGYPYYSFFYEAYREYYPICSYFQILITVV